MWCSSLAALTLGRQRQTDPWGSLASPSNKSEDYPNNERICINKEGREQLRKTPYTNLKPLHTPQMIICMHIPTYTCPNTRIYYTPKLKHKITTKKKKSFYAVKVTTKIMRNQVNPGSSDTFLCHSCFLLFMQIKFIIRTF